MAEVDPQITDAVRRIQMALMGCDMETALNAVAIQTAVLAVLTAEDKAGALSVIRDSAKQSREIVQGNWGKPDMDLMRRQMRGETVQ